VRSTILLVFSLSTSALGVPPTIHVAWDETPAPQSPDDYVITTTTDPDAPDVELITGSLTWRIWSTDPDNPNGYGDIGVISSPHPANFAVRIISPTDTDIGARNVKAIRLVPSSSSNYASMPASILGPAGSIIDGQLTDEVIVQPDSTGTGGELSLRVFGDVTANMALHRVTGLEIAGEASGTIVINDLSEIVSFGELTGSLSAATASDGAGVRVFQPMSGTCSVAQIASVFIVFMPSGMAPTGVLTFGTFVVPSSSVFLEIKGVDGTIRFLDGIPEFITLRFLAASDGNSFGGLVSIDGQLDGLISGGDLSGDVVISGSGISTGSIEMLGDLKNGSTVTIQGDYTGDIHADADNDGVGAITGDVTVAGEFDGDIAGSNLIPGGPLPPNIKICDFGDEATVRGQAPSCPAGQINIGSASPPTGLSTFLIDARQPHDLSCSQLQGVGSGSEPITLALSNGGSPVADADNALCWELCDTLGDAVPVDACGATMCNRVVDVVETAPGTYRLMLDRPVSASHWTTLTYRAGAPTNGLTYGSLPGDVSGDGTTGPLDILRWIDHSNGVNPGPFGAYSADINRSGAIESQDLLRLIDLYNGAGSYDVWLNVSLPEQPCVGTAPLSPLDLLCDGCDEYLAYLGSQVPPSVTEACAQAPLADGEGCQYVGVTPQTGSTLVALLLIGGCVDSQSSCVSAYVQEDGTLGDEPLYRTQAQWGSVHVHGPEIVPSAKYIIRPKQFSDGQLLAPQAGTTYMWADTDVPWGGQVELNDILCVLNAFERDYTATCTFYSANLYPCPPNNAIDLDDILTVLDAFAGEPFRCEPPCEQQFQMAMGSGGGGEGPAPAPGTLRFARNHSAGGTGLVAVNVFLSGTGDVRGYQLSLEAIAGPRAQGRLEVDAMTIDQQRTDFIFRNVPPGGRGELPYYTAVDRVGRRIAVALPQGGVTPTGEVYLGTVLLRREAGARGRFHVRHRPEHTLLRDSGGQAIEVADTGGADIDLPE